MRRVYPVMAAGLMLISCREEGPPPAPEVTASPSASATATSETRASGARAVSEETDDYLFEYSYPAEAGNIPELAALLDSRLEEVRTQLATQAAEGREAAGDDGFPFNKYSATIEWQVVADTPRFLSLSANVSDYTGGAHGMYGFDTLVWDKEAKARLDPVDFFTALDALDAVVSADLCEMLNRERAERRGAPVPEGSEEWMDACVKLSDTTLLLGSSNGRAFNRIGVQIGPYVAGPYAEGAYEFTLPVSAKVLAVVADEYKSAFAARN